MKSFFVISALLCATLANAGDIKYPVNAIPAELRNEANVVKRLEEVSFEILSLREAVHKFRLVYTILNENGDSYATMVQGYDKLRKITSFEGTLYDARGNVLKKTKSKDIQDYSAVSDISLYDDNRVKVHDFNYRTYPFTVEYEVEYRINTTYSIPSWYPQTSARQSVETSSYTLTVPSGYDVRHKAFNYKEKPLITEGKGKSSLTWKVKSLPTFKIPFAPPLWHEMTTAVFFAPTEFEMDGFKGNAVTWNEFGKFFQQLNKDRDKLPDDMVQKVQELSRAAKDDKEKVYLIYQYLQKNTRYISVQLGIGGLQPFDANYVAKKGYGDCKALSNYMHSMLKATGIRSYLTLVNAGDEMDDKFLDEGLPSHRFNHMILCVPLAQDTMWLECTSQTTAAGYMGSFTGNRKALLITDEGGKLVSTPRYGLKENRQKRKITAVLNEDGSLRMMVHTEFAGLLQDDRQSMVNYLSREKVKERLQENLQLASYEVNDFKYDEEKGKVPLLKEALDVTVINYATITGKRIFITPNILNRGGYKLSEEPRTADFVFDNDFHFEDEVEIEIPAGYEIESMGKDVVIQSRFGLYSIASRLEGNKIIYKRVRENYSGRFPAADQTDIVKFYTDIYQADRSRMVLVRKE